MDTDGSVRKTLSVLTEMGYNISPHIINSIRNKETWSHISDKYFDKKYFKNIKDKEIRDICSKLCEYNGDHNAVFSDLNNKYPDLNVKNIMDIKNKVWFTKISDEYFKKNQFPKYRKCMFNEKDVRKICQLIIKYKGDCKMVYDKLKTEIPNISAERVRDIKNKGSYKNISDEYFDNPAYTDHSIPVDILDMIRDIANTNTIKRSPLATYNAINHDKYPKLTKNVISMIINNHPRYGRSNKYDLNQFNKNSDYKPLPPDTLNKFINSYNSGDSDINDEIYDRLLEEYLKYHGGESSRPYTRNKQTDAVNNLVSTLPKVYGIRTPMREGQKTYEQWINTKKINPNQRILAQPKFDGCSVAYDFNTRRFFTRGDYENGESVDVTELFADRIDWLDRWRENNDRPWPYTTVGLKFEAILDVDSYDHYNRTHPDSQYKRPRDYVAAAMTSRDVEMCKRISLIELRGLTSDGREYIPAALWNTSVQTTAGNYERLETFIKDCLNRNATFKMAFDPEIDVVEDYKIDGVVISVCEEEPGEECFINNDNEVAVKILKDIKQTKLRDIIWQIGKTGKITPVARLQPVKFDNVTVDHVTLSTFDRVFSMDLRYDDTVDIMYNIVPYFVGTHHDGSLQIPIPTKCPSCGEPLNTKVLKQVRCLNPNCPSVILGGIVRYCEKMKMMGVSDGIIDDLYNNNIIKTIPELYEINTGMISHLPGYGSQSEANIINAIWKASEDVELHKWFGAMPINDISDKTWKTIFDTIFQKDMNSALQNISIMIKSKDKAPLLDALIMYGNKFPNIGAAKLRSIVHGIHQTWDLICKTFPYIKFKTYPTGLPTKGFVAMTGTRDPELTATLVQNGWDVCDFNTKVNVLIVPNKSFTSRKTELAKKHNIPIRTVEEIYDMLR